MSASDEQEKQTLTVVVDDDLGFKRGVANSDFIQSSEHGLTADGPARLHSDDGAAVVTIQPSIDIAEDEIHVDTYTGQLLGLGEGGGVTIEAIQFDYADEITYRNSVEIDNTNQPTEQFEELIKERFMDKFVGKQETLPIAADDGKISLEVHSFLPDDVECVRMSEDTEVTVELVDRGSMTGTIPSADDLDIKYEDLYGREDAQTALRDYVENPLTENDLFEAATPPTGVLLHGPKGAGKTQFAKAIGNEIDATMRIVSGDALEQDDLDAASSLRDVFHDARRYQPAVIIIESLGRVMGDGNGVLATALKSELDKIDTEDRVVVLGELDHLSNVPSGFHQSGRFGYDVWVGLPDKEDRRNLIADITEDLTHTLSDRQIEQVVEETVGYSGRDLHNVFNKANLNMQHRLRDEYGDDYSNLTDVVAAEDEGISMGDVEVAMDKTRPQAVERYSIENIYYGETEWESLIGLDDQIQSLVDLVAGPNAAPDLYTDEEETDGMLLHGPRGTGKTAIVEAASYSTGRPIVQLDVTHLVRDSTLPVEDALHEVFNISDDIEPSILHLTRLHSMGIDTEKARAITQQLRAEFDDLGVENGVVVVGETETPYDPAIPLVEQTNLYGALHPSLLEHGRFGHHKSVPLPDNDVREDLFQTRLSNMADGDTIRLGDLDPEELVEESVGLSGAAIHHICFLARRHARQSLLKDGETAQDLDNDETVTIQQDDVLAAIHEYRSQHAEADMDAEENDDEDATTGSTTETDEEGTESEVDEEEEDEEEDDDDDDDGFMWE